MLWFRLMQESLSFAWQSIWTNKLRTMLSLLGVMVGIFVIGSVFAVVDSLESELRDTFNMLDEDVLFVTKRPGRPKAKRIILVEVRPAPSAHGSRPGPSDAPFDPG